MPTLDTEDRLAVPAKAVNRIRMASFGALTMLIIQFVLGAAYSIYGTAPTPAKSVGMFSSPLLAIHVILGILLVIAAIMLVVRAIAKKGNTPHELLGTFLAYLFERHGRRIASINIQVR